MEAAREAVRSFTAKHGQHHTDVEERVNPAVTREIVKPSRHEEFTEAVDREVHQHHYHTTVQPVTHREVIPEVHTHNLLPIEKKEFHHGDHQAVKDRVSAELSRFIDTSVTEDVVHTRGTAAAVAGEHVHHHVHETVQPVIHKETVRPEIVHTTVPIHEIHHREAHHHGLSALPMKTLEEFTKAGGVLHGTQQFSHEEYDGAPRPYNKNLQTTAEKVLSHVGLGHHDGKHRKTDSGIGVADHSPRTSTTTTTTTNTNITGPTTTHTGIGHNGAAHNGAGHNGLPTTTTNTY